MTEQKVPPPAYELTDMDQLNEVRMNSHASFILMQNILREYHGDLDSAKKPTIGQIVSQKFRFENYGTLFK